MASPLQTGKRAVNLAPPRVPGSRIRRDPPPVAKKVAVQDPEERDRRMAVVGILSFALALAAIVVAFSSYDGWSPRQIIVRL